MSLTLRSDFGCTEAVIDEDCGLKRFYEVAEILDNDLHITFTKKLDDFDSVIWEFKYRELDLTLHYNIYTGISVYPSNCGEAVKKENNAVISVAKYLESKLMVNKANRFLQ